MPALLLALLAACAPTDSSVLDEPSDTGGADTDDSGESPIDPPEDWPEAWGVVSMGLGCLDLAGTGLGSEAERAQAIAEHVVARDVVALALQDVCASGTDDALALLLVALEAASGVGWASQWQPTATGDGTERGLALAAWGGLADPYAQALYTQGDRERWVLGATLDSGARLFTTQLEQQDADLRGVQARELVATVMASSDPDLDLIIAADLSDENRSSAVWAITGAGFVEDTADQDDDLRHLLHHRGADLEPVSSALLFDGSDGAVVADRPSVASWYGPGAGEDACITRLRADIAVASGEWVAVRGTDFPLDWGYGLPTWQESGSSWVYVTSEIEDAAFEWKALLEDETWQTGDNLEGQGCQDNQTTPEWEVPEE